MNKKGFTLVELLAVIVILSIITIVSFTIIFKLVSKSRDNIYEENIKLLEKAAEKWQLDHEDLVGTTTPYCLDVADIEKGGYISKDSLKDPRQTKSKKIEGYVKITYDTTYKQYEFEYVEQCN